MMNKNVFSIFVLLIILLAAWGCSGGGTSQDHFPGTTGVPSWSDPVLAEGQVGIWMTTPDKKNLLTAKTPINFTPDSGSSSYTITVNENVAYQEMDGFGGSFTDSAAWLVYTKIDVTARETLMTRLFDYDNGIGMSFIRQPMGSPDFATKIYSYDDRPADQPDPDLTHFSITHDEEYIIPTLKIALAKNPNLKIMASPWSPPGWMKTTGAMIGGSLKDEYYQSYANYFVKFIQAYKAHGIDIYAVTPQNEPHYVPINYPGMRMEDEEQILLIKDYLYPAFQAATPTIHSKIICWDHNWDNTAYAERVLNACLDTVAGTAWHYYGGTPEAMSYIHNKFPNKGIWFTEGGSGSWNNLGTFHNSFMDQMRYVIRIPRNYSKTIVWWNIALNQNNGPIVFHNTVNRGMVTINQNNGSITYNVDYFTMGHISRFVRPGALRIESNTFENDLENVAFRNPDGSKVLIISNRTNNSRDIKVVWGTQSFSYTIPGKAAVTFKWPDNP